MLFGFENDIDEFEHLGNWNKLRRSGGVGLGVIKDMFGRQLLSFSIWIWLWA